MKKKPFTKSFDCQVRAHCETCRKSAAWRKNVGAPEKCTEAFKPTATSRAYGMGGKVLQKFVSQQERGGCSKCGLSPEEKAKMKEIKAAKREEMKDVDSN